MADSDRYRLETIARIQKRELQATCPHELQSLDVPSRRFVCDDCGAKLPRGSNDV